MDWLNQEWINNEAMSNYITFAAGIIFTAIGWMIVRAITRNKPSIIRVEKVFDTSLIDIHPRIRDKLRITYEDRPIEGFHEAIFKIHNTGEKPIEDIELIFAIEELSTVDFLEVVFTNTERIEEFTVLNPSKPKEDTEDSLAEHVSKIMVNPLDYDPVALDPDAFAIHLPFLNPYKIYEDYLGITLYSPKSIVVKGVVGKGVGWTTKYVDKTVYYEKVLQSLSNAASPVTFLAGKILEVWIR